MLVKTPTPQKGEKNLVFSQCLLCAHAVQETPPTLHLTHTHLDQDSILSLLYILNTSQRG